MRKTMPVSEYMSRLPQEIDRRERLTTAIRMMETHAVRHLPVMDGSHLVGVLSRQDVQNAFQRHGGSAEAVAVGDVCTREPLTLSPSTAMSEAARRMLERAVTSALVVDGGVLVGIFTSVDALRVLADL
jgi:acetoin utilization protein AcuB